MESVEILNENDAEDKFQDFLKGGGLDVEEMKTQKEKKENDLKLKKNDKEEEKEEEKEKIDIEPDENMKGYLAIEIVKLGIGE